MVKKKDSNYHYKFVNLCLISLMIEKKRVKWYIREAQATSSHTQTHTKKWMNGIIYTFARGLWLHATPWGPGGGLVGPKGAVGELHGGRGAGIQTLCSSRCCRILPPPWPFSAISCPGRPLGHPTWIRLLSSASKLDMACWSSQLEIFCEKQL